jgi:hypothetical protein
MFSDLTELHRTFTYSVRDFGLRDELEKEAVRLKEHLHVSSSERKSSMRTVSFSAVELSGNSLVDVNIGIRESWRSQDFDRYCTLFEEETSILCDPTTYRKDGYVPSGGPGQLFSPVVQNTGNQCLLVVGHTGIIMGDRLIVPEALNQLSGGTPERAMRLGEFPVYVAKAGLTRPPADWSQLGSPDISYQVVVTPDGCVTGLRQYSSRGVESANWVIDLVVAPAVLALAKSGARMAMSLMESMPVGKAPTLAGMQARKIRTLGGPTRELARELVAARKLSTAQPGGTASPGMGGVLRVEHSGRRTLILGDDMAVVRSDMARSHSVSGFHDVVIHANEHGFQYLTTPRGLEVWRELSVQDVVRAVRDQLAPGDKIRLLACKAGKNVKNVNTPAQQLADELGREVWAADATVWSIPGRKLPSGRFEPGRAFVPGDGKVDGFFGRYVPKQPK